MNKVKKIKIIQNYLLAFFLPFVICLAIFYFKDVLQNVEKIYVSDLRAQHVVFLNYLKNVLLGDASIFYSFYAGVGSPMMSTIIFYCISPLNLLLLIVDDIRYAVLFIYIVKVSLSGLTMFILLKYKTNKDNFIVVLFSICYALSSFIINYFFCVFWFDSLYLAPLVMLGIDKIIKYEKMSLLYIFSLALAIICNIQMGFGLCVYSVIYYLYSFNINYSIKKDFNKFKQLGGIFVISSLCVGAISSGVLLGFIIDYMNISVSRDFFGSITTYVSNLGYILKNFLTVGNLKSDYYNNYEPFIYCGLIVSFFSVLYLFNKDISTKKRFHSLCVILVFILSFCISFLNLFWHVTFPILLNFRYSAYLGLFLTMLSCECYLTKDKFIKKDIIVLSILLLIGFFILVGYSNEVYVIWTFVFLILLFVLVILVKTKVKKFEVLLSVVVIAEIFVNGYLSIYVTGEVPANISNSYDSFKKLVSFNDFDDNYRVMYNYSFVDFMNDTLFLNENSSLRYFSSVVNRKLINFFKRNGTSVADNGYLVSAYDSPLLISLMGNKYLYLTEELNNNIYKKIDSYEITDYDFVKNKKEKKIVYLYENPYSLSLGYVIKSDVKYEKGMNLVDYQNKIIKSFTGGDDDVLIRLEYTMLPVGDMCNESTFYTCKIYEIYNDTNNPFVYVYRDFDTFSVFGNTGSYTDTVDMPILLSSTNMNIVIRFEENYDIDDQFIVTTYDESNLINNLDILRQNMLENIEINGNILSGTIDSDKSGILFLSIPYSNKFNIYVDGKKVNYYSLLNDAFIGVDIEEGQHEIVIKYVDKNFKLYIILTIISVIVTVLLYKFINKFISKKQEEKRKNEEKLRQEELLVINTKNTKNKKGKSKRKR